MVDACRQLFLVVCHHYHRFVASLAESLYHVFYESSVAIVKSVERFVEYKQLRILNESPCQKYKSLFTAR